MNILCIGDIVGTPGCEMVLSQIKYLKQDYDVDFVIANGENAASGNGITTEKAEKLIDAGIDVITLGNHSFAKPDAGRLMDSGFPMIRPLNLPAGTPGKGFILKECCGQRIAVLNALGRVYMNPVNSPFEAVSQCLEELNGKADIIILDFHAEATSEKVAMGWYLDGKVTAVFGTHTHVPTADERILPGGTAYITDIGMTGPYNSVLGVDKDIAVNRFLTLMNKRFEVAQGNSILSGILIKTNCSNVTSVSRINIC